MEQTDAVTEIFQFPQIMGGNDRGKVSVDQLRREKTLYRLTDNGIKPVKCFVTEKIFCPGAQTQQDGYLFFSFPLKTS